jgi:uncharacterized protein
MGWSRLDLGLGIVVSAGLDLLWDDIRSLVDVVEVEPQTMWAPRQDGGWDLAEEAFGWVESLPVPVIAHGVGFPVGGCERPEPAGVTLAAHSARRLGAAHWSEHLSFNRATVNGTAIDAGFLLPPAQTWAGVEAAAEHVADYRAAATLPFLIETGVNYLRPRPEELSDGAFVAAVADRGDCGILLDLHNLLANERNGREPVRDVLAELPLERVLEVHVAGGFAAGGYYLDAHVGGPDGELLALLARTLPRLPNVRAVTFEAVPEALAALGAAGVRSVLQALHRVIDDSQVHGIWRRPEQAGRRAPGPPPSGTRRATAATREWEQRLAAYTSRAADDPPGTDPGFGLLRQLADQARLGQLVLAQPGLMRSLVVSLGIDRTDEIVHRYLRARPPQRWTAREGEQFASWLAGSIPSGLDLASRQEKR